MSAEILSALLAANIAAGIAILIVVLARKIVRRLIGARLAYWLWATPVLTGLATLLPPHPHIAAAPGAPILPAAQAAVATVASWQPTTVIAADSFSLLPALLGLWLLGALGFLSLMLLQQWMTLRPWKTATHEP